MKYKKKARCWDKGPKNKEKLARLFNNYNRLEPNLQSIIVKLSQLKRVKERASSKDLKHPEYFRLLEEPILMSIKNDLREIEQEDE